MGRDVAFEERESLMDEQVSRYQKDSDAVLRCLFSKLAAKRQVAHVTAMTQRDEEREQDKFAIGGNRQMESSCACPNELAARTDSWGAKEFVQTGVAD
jgi:hypothetical protein